MSGYLCVGECQHYIEQDIYINKLKQEVEKLKAELLKVEAQRDLIICQGHCDSLTKELKQQLAEKDKVIYWLAESLCMLDMDQDIEDLIKQAEQSAKGV